MELSQVSCAQSPLSATFLGPPSKQILRRIHQTDKRTRLDYLDCKIKGNPILLNDPNSPKETAETFYQACRDGYKKIAKLLLPQINEVNDLHIGFIEACKNGRVDLVKEFLQNSRFDPARNHAEVVQVACIAGQADIVEILLADPRISVDDGYFVLYTACSLGKLEVVKVFAKNKKYDMTHYESNALSRACFYGQLPVVEYLLENTNVDPTANKIFPLYVAAENGHVEVVKKLLEHIKKSLEATREVAVSINQLDNYEEIRRRLNEEVLEIYNFVYDKNNLEVRSCLDSYLMNYLRSRQKNQRNSIEKLTGYFDSLVQKKTME